MTTDAASHSHTTTTLDAAIAAETARAELAEQANASAITALTARVAALEGATPPPDPTPPPSGRPWAAPVTTRTVPIPASIDKTGATDVTAALKSFIAGVPDGSIITGGGPSAIYRISGAFLPSSRNHLIIDGQGATLNNVANANSGSGWAPYADSFFWWTYGVKPYPTHLTFQNWVAKAASPKPGYQQSGEYAAFLHAMGGSYLEVTNVTASGLFGDFATFNEDSEYAWVHDNHMLDCGRNSVSVVCGSHILVEDNAFDIAGYCGFDIEPETGSIAGLTDIVYRRNAHQLWRANDFMSLDGVDAGKAISAVTVDSNTVASASLLSVLGGATGKARPSNVAFTNNQGAAGGSIAFRHIDGLTVKGNTAAGKVLAPSLTDCPGAVTA